MNKKEAYFGSPSRIRQYRVLLYIGLALLLVGGILFIFEEVYKVAGIVTLFIGLMCAVAGALGIGEEKKKQGVKIKSTPSGIIALIFGVIGVFLSNRAYLGIILGIIAIIFAVISVKKGDNQYGLAGGICGIIGIVINIYVGFLFTYFI